MGGSNFLGIEKAGLPGGQLVRSPKNCKKHSQERDWAGCRGLCQIVEEFCYRAEGFVVCLRLLLLRVGSYSLPGGRNTDEPFSISPLDGSS